MILVWFEIQKFPLSGRRDDGGNFWITTLDRDDFGLDQSKIMTAIYFNSLERDSSGKPLHTFRIPL
jgi:hypothetical protein